VNELVWLQEPPAHPPEPLDDQLPRGPLPLPERLQACADEAPAAMTIAAIAAALRYVLIERMYRYSLLRRLMASRELRAAALHARFRTRGRM